MGRTLKTGGRGPNRKKQLNTVLDGVSGAGKTRAAQACIRDALARGAQVWVLAAHDEYRQFCEENGGRWQRDSLSMACDERRRGLSVLDFSAITDPEQRKFGVLAALWCIADVMEKAPLSRPMLLVLDDAATLLSGGGLAMEESVSRVWSLAARRGAPVLSVLGWLPRAGDDDAPVREVIHRSVQCYALERDGLRLRETAFRRITLPELLETEWRLKQAPAGKCPAAGTGRDNHERT